MYRFRFEKLYRRHSQRVYILAWRLSFFNVRDAEDITQETFLRALGAFQKYSHQNREWAWLRTICINIVREQWRRNRFFEDNIRPTANEFCCSGWTPDPARTAETTERLEKVFSVMKHLKPDFREALMFKHFVGMSDQEIAKHQNISIATVRSRIRRARNLLTELLSKEETP
ncbi:RNA polymerase sigma factor [bacterium]|nr:RNA polymerase sigma factor [bacterium]